MGKCYCSFAANSPNHGPSDKLGANNRDDCMSEY